MIFGSVCSGIEAASVAWNPLGWKAAFFAEIEPFPCKLLKAKYPEVPNYGDITRFAEWPDATLDLLIGGTPCQSFSVAGKRGGTYDPRGRLMFSFVGIAERYRPRWIVWENVPGVLSSGRGRDFGALLGALGELGYGLAWRVLDAQHFGVPQRRRRVFLVGCFGDPRRACEVLFEPEGVRWDSAERGDDSEPDGETFGTITTRTGRTGSRCNYSCECGHCIVDKEGLPRWITEEEAELAQGFPRGYTSAGTAKARYKAIGNSMATPVVRWIGERIQRVHDSR